MKSSRGILQIIATMMRVRCFYLKGGNSMPMTPGRKAFLELFEEFIREAEFQESSPGQPLPIEQDQVKSTSACRDAA